MQSLRDWKKCLNCWSVCNVWLKCRHVQSYFKDFKEIIPWISCFLLHTHINNSNFREKYWSTYAENCKNHYDLKVWWQWHLFQVKFDDINDSKLRRFIPYSELADSRNESILDIESNMQYRKSKLQQECSKFGLNVPSSDNVYQPGEYLISREHRLVWCNVFKSASTRYYK